MPAMPARPDLHDCHCQHTSQHRQRQRHLEGLLSRLFHHSFAKIFTDQAGSQHRGSRQPHKIDIMWGKHALHDTTVDQQGKDPDCCGC